MSRKRAISRSSVFTPATKLQANLVRNLASSRIQANCCTVAVQKGDEGRGTWVRRYLRTLLPVVHFYGLEHFSLRVEPERLVHGLSTDHFAPRRKLLAI